MDRMLDRSMAGNLEVGKKAPDFEMIRLLSHKNETPKSRLRSGSQAKVEIKGSSKEAENTKREKTEESKELLRLSSFQGKKPVVLIFGSYT